MKVQSAIFSCSDYPSFFHLRTAPMIRVTFLIDRGEDSESYAVNSFLPLLHALPDTLRLDAARVIASAAGEVRARIIIDVFFEDEARMNLAFASSEGRRISREIMNSAGSGMEMVTSEVLAAGGKSA